MTGKDDYLPHWREGGIFVTDTSRTDSGRPLLARLPRGYRKKRLTACPQVPTSSLIAGCLSYFNWSSRRLLLSRLDPMAPASFPSRDAMMTVSLFTRFREYLFTALFRVGIR